MKRSISSTLDRLLQNFRSRYRILILLFSSLAFLILALLTSSQQEHFIAKYVEEIADRSILEGGSLFLQKDINILAESLNSNSLIPVEISISVDKQTFARSSLDSQAWLSRMKVVHIKHASNLDIQITILSIYDRFIFLFALSLLFFYAVDTLIHRSLRKRLHKKLNLLSHEMNLIFDEILLISQSAESESLAKIEHFLKNSDMGFEETENLKISVSNFISKISNLNQKLAHVEFEAGQVVLAKRVAHDIRSPLAVLSLCVQKIKHSDPQSTQLLNGAISRIKEIADDILKKTKPIGNQASINQTQQSWRMDLALNELITEKKTEFEQLQLKWTVELVEAVYSKATKTETLRHLSNIINNAIDATHGPEGHLEIKMTKTDDMIEIHIRDNGQGIPPHILSKLGKELISYGKKTLEEGSGCGIGLYSCHKFMSSFGGKIEINSQEQLFTDVKLSFPI